MGSSGDVGVEIGDKLEFKSDAYESWPEILMKLTKKLSHVMGTHLYESIFYSWIVCQT